MLHYLFILFLGWNIVTVPATPTGELAITVKNIKTIRGDIRVAVFNSEDDFLKPGKSITNKIVKVTNNKMVIRFRNLKPGYYAIAIYHDKNSDGKMNKNLLGVPTEYYGFSRDARARFSAPSFDAAKFYYKGGTSTTAITLK